MECGCAERCACIMDKIPEEVVEEMCQLVKANSIEGCKRASVHVVCVVPKIAQSYELSLTQTHTYSYVIQL